MALGTQLKAARAARHMTQHDLALDARVDRAVIAQLETGIRHNIYFDTALRLAIALDVSLDYLAEREELPHAV